MGMFNETSSRYINLFMMCLKHDWLYSFGDLMKKTWLRQKHERVQSSMRLMRRKKLFNQYILFKYTTFTAMWFTHCFLIFHVVAVMLVKLAVCCLQSWPPVPRCIVSKPRVDLGKVKWFWNYEIWLIWFHCVFSKLQQLGVRRSNYLYILISGEERLYHFSL